MKVRIIDGTYSFIDQINGKVFEAEEQRRPSDKALMGYRVFIHFGHGDNFSEYPERAWTFPASAVVIVPDDTELSTSAPLAVFKVGDRIVLRHNSKQIMRNGSAWNPVNMHGEIDRVDFDAGEYNYHVIWANGIRNDYDAEDLALVKPSQNAPRRKRGKVQKRKQTTVYIVYNDGTDYEIRRAKHVVVNQDHKSLNVDTESVAKGGLVIRHNTSIPFAAIESVRVSTPDGDTCYYFKKGAVYMTAKEHTATSPFKTQIH